MKQEVQKRLYRRFQKNGEIQIMEKTMYRADIEDARLTESYLIPRTTLLGWKEKRGNPTDWRSVVLDRLSLLAEMQDRKTEKLKAIFKKDELMAIWGSQKHPNRQRNYKKSRLSNLWFCQLLHIRRDRSIAILQCGYEKNE